jgi:hypothetical protein
MIVPVTPDFIGRIADALRQLSYWWARKPTA